MKNLIIAVATLMSVPAFAGSVCDKSWSEVNQSGYYVDYPKVQFGTIWLGVDGVCKAGENLQSTHAVEVCVEWSTGEGSDCVKSEMKTLSTPINYMKEVPDRNGGEKLVEIPQTHPMNYDIEVGHLRNAFQVVCKKSFTIPACDL